MCQFTSFWPNMILLIVSWTLHVTFSSSTKVRNIWKAQLSWHTWLNRLYDWEVLNAYLHKSEIGSRQTELKKTNKICLDCEQLLQPKNFLISSKNVCTVSLSLLAKFQQWICQFPGQQCLHFIKYTHTFWGTCKIQCTRLTVLKKCK